jgi:hypothetical protein
MDIQLRCTRCPCRFGAAWHTPAAEVLDRMAATSWFARAEGDTFEEMVFAALGRRGAIRCPECRGGARVSGTGLGTLQTAGAV